MPITLALEVEIVQGQPGLHSETLSLKTNKQTKSQNKNKAKQKNNPQTTFCITKHKSILLGTQTW
jgi:hypothetical protein